MDFRNRWVLVTGASSGLGRAMALLLAREHGANLVAVARRANLLEELASEVSRCGVQIETLVADLSQAEGVDAVVRKATIERPVYAAVLNAGVTHFGDYRHLEWTKFDEMLRLNVRSNVRLTTALLPALEQRGEGGGILLVASMAGMTPIPYQAAYSGTKAFLVHFGCSLWHEIQGKNVSLTTFAPGGIVTEMTAGESFVPLRKWLMPVDQAAREGIEAFRARKYLYVPGATNRLGAALMRLLPQKTVTGRIAAVYRRALERTREKPGG